MIVIKILLGLSLLIIIIQDFKSRQIWWFLPFLVGLLGGALYFETTLIELYFLNIYVNVLITTSVLLIIYLYNRVKLKMNFLKQVIGLGDIFFMLCFALLFPILSFLNFFSFAILFSLVFYVLLKNTFSKSNIPLAGCMSIFLLIVYICHWTGLYTKIYVL